MPPSDPMHPMPIGSRIIALERRVHLLTVLIAILIVIFFVDLLSGGVLEAAFEDYQQFPPEVRQHLVYLTTIALPHELAEQGEIALRLALPSLSRTVVLERQLPQEVVPKLFRIDLRHLDWEGVLPGLLLEHYPYRRDIEKRPLVVRADWFVQYFLDQKRSGDAYFKLLFGDKAPANEAEFRQLLGVQNKSQFRVSHIEDASGVSLAKTRQIDVHPTTTNFAFFATRDSEAVTAASDPLEHLDGDFVYDASEMIGALPKVSLRTGDTGLLQVYALANAAGELQTFAPAAIVVDSTNIRGVEIRNSLSCISCHDEGLKQVNINSLRRYVESGALVAAQKPLDELIERRYLADLSRTIERHNEDYARTVLLATSVDADSASAAVRAVVQWYDGDVTLEQAAREAGTDKVTFLGWLASEGVNGNSLNSRVAQLSHGVPIQRTVWEEAFNGVLSLAP